MFQAGRLGGTGYVSILPVDQGIEHSAAPASPPTPLSRPPQHHRAGPRGGLQRGGLHVRGAGRLSRRYAHRIPFIVKMNHNELLTYPNKHDQIMFGSVRQAYDLGAAGVGATVYFGSEESTRQLQEVSAAFAEAHPRDNRKVYIMKLQTVSFIGAMLLSAAMSTAIAQTTAPATPPQPSTQPSPTTPPTHPTQRNMQPADQAASGAMGTKSASLEEARQACKNMSGDAQRDCLKKADEDFKKSGMAASAPTK